MYRLATLAGVLAAAMPLGNPRADLDNAPSLVRSVEDQVRMTLPYVYEAFDGKQPIEKEREAAVERYHQMYQRSLKEGVDMAPPTPVVIKQIKGKRHA